jgi:hypothetical protein
MSDLKLPQFAAGADESKWWFANDAKVAADFQTAAIEGRLGRGGVLRLLTERGFKPAQPLPTTTIRLDPADIAKARQRAAERGLRYQTYLKMIIHEELCKGESEQKSPAA